MSANRRRASPHASTGCGAGRARDPAAGRRPARRVARLAAVTTTARHPRSQTTTATDPARPTRRPRRRPPRPTEPGGVADCDATTLAVAMTATAESFGPGQSPAFTVSITNNGSEPCLVDAGRGEPRDRHHLGRRPGLVQPRLHRRRDGDPGPAAARAENGHLPARVEPRAVRTSLPAGPAGTRRRDRTRPSSRSPVRRRRPRCSGWADLPASLDATSDDWVRRTARGCSTRPAGRGPRGRRGRAARRRRRRP